MREFIVSSEEEAVQVGEKQEAEGYKLACASNCGLPAGKFRLTYLPLTAFDDGEKS